MATESFFCVLVDSPTTICTQTALRGLSKIKKEHMKLRAGKLQERKEFGVDLTNTYYTCMKFWNNKKLN